MRNLPDNSPHILDVDLIRFADGEMPVRAVTGTETHLRTCNKCRTRLDQLKSGANAYDQYHAHVLKPNLELPREWSSLQVPLESLEKPRNRIFLPTRIWWTTAALACCAIVVGWFIYRDAPTRRMQQVLARAVVVRMPPHRRLQIRANGHNWYRAATVQGRINQKLLQPLPASAQLRIGHAQILMPLLCCCQYLTK